MKILSILFILLLSYSMNLDELPQKKADEKFDNIHKINSFVLGIAMGMLLFICFFSYIFSSFGFHLFPEPSVCLICGMLVGYGIRYFRNHSTKFSDHSTCNLVNVNSTPPEAVLVNFKDKTLEYEFHGFHEPNQIMSDTFSSKVMFDPDIFFYLFLPPIIFNFGFKMKKKYFFKNLGSVLLIALLGTFLTMIVFSIMIYIYSFFDPHARDIGLDFTQSLTFGIVICSTDPVSVLSVFTQLGVDADLYSIILGESALNDAVSMVSQRTLNDYVNKYSKQNIALKFTHFLKSFGIFFWTLIGSFTIGATFALLNAFLVKASSLRKFSTIESAIFLVLSYASFLVTEMCGMVGIVGILFCGMFQVHYTRENLSEDSKIFLDKIILLICFFFENFLFCYMGITVFVYSRHIWNIGFIIWSFISLMVSRGITVYFLCYVLNKWRFRKIPINFQHIIFLSGLKGAISFALALEDTSSEIRHLILTSTIVLVLITVLIFGGLMSNLLKFLEIPIFEDINSNDLCVTPKSIDPKTLWLTATWQKFDESFMIPFFTNEGPTYSVIFVRIFHNFICIINKKRHEIEPIFTKVIDSTDVNCILNDASFLQIPTRKMSTDTDQSSIVLNQIKNLNL